MSRKLTPCFESARLSSPADSKKIAKTKNSKGNHSSKSFDSMNLRKSHENIVVMKIFKNGPSNTMSPHCKLHTYKLKQCSRQFSSK